MAIAAFVDAAAALTATLGEVGSYTPIIPGPAITLRAIVRRDIQAPITGMEGMTIERRSVIAVDAAALAGHVPVLGDTVTVGTETWKVLAIEQDDGYLVRLKVRKVA